MTDHDQKNETEGKRAGLFEEDNGNISSIRLMSFVALIQWCPVSFLHALKRRKKMKKGELFA